MPITLTDEIKALVDGSNFAHLATLMPDGSRQSVPVWVGRERERLLICTGENSLKERTPGAILAWRFRSLISTTPIAKRSYVVALWMAIASTSTPSRTSTQVSRSHFAATKEERRW